MIKNKFKSILLVGILLIITGCVKQESLPPQPSSSANKEFDKNFKIGIISNVGNIFEYFYNNNPLLPYSGDHKFIAINNWDVDQLIEGEYKSQLEKRGYKNIEMIYPTEKLISIKNQGKNLYFIEHFNELLNIVTKNNLDVLFYIENFPTVNGKNMKFGENKNIFVTKNLSIYANKSLINQKIDEYGLFLFHAEILKFGPKVENGKKVIHYWNSPRAYTKKLMLNQNISYNNSYSMEKLDELKPFFEDIIQNAIGKYFEEEQIN
ncbi:hypothetical protein [Arcobacter sp.]|uniref:hypothetical protein n=1 Tax=unclassified Arcobacter TaxID=2593671 RepID=UPI003AFFA114|eukprot:TRINITY_DN155_c0_g1_i2.p1 TRINITY_DN155_c0_g1~~TRINITY_DN155_c0_g1_i2.p1  ORF type:complete len:264 (+),score=-79.84 TRINITY_DN155_c0_g1_i2:478-1269(+)